jgi:hypothetical protein
MSIFPSRLCSFHISYIQHLLISGPYLRLHFYTSQYPHRYSSPEATALLAVLGALPAMPNARRQKPRERMNMRSRITVAMTVVAFGTALATAPAFAQTRQPAPSYSNTGPFGGAPLSPGGIGASSASFGGPGGGYIGPSGGGSATPTNYSNTGPTGAPLSPGGIGASSVSFGGQGYNQTAGASPNPSPSGSRQGRALYAYSGSGTPAPSYSNTKASGSPLSPGGIGASSVSFGGPGYQGN